MTIWQRILGAAALVAGLTLLVGCGEEAVDDLDRIDAAPSEGVSPDAIEPAEDERVMPAETVDETEPDQQY
ncbi:hypothetical protein [Halopseudomonas sp.]|uniref:hypothetical protein n=1 Tax=Halopseudomonas sp. TaxID=2901191 RepID=UPI0035687E41